MQQPTIPKGQDDHESMLNGGVKDDFVGSNIGDNFEPIPEEHGDRMQEKAGKFTVDLMDTKLTNGNKQFMKHIFEQEEIYPGKDHFLNYLAFHAGLFGLEQIVTSQEVYGEVAAAV